MTNLPLRSDIVFLEHHTECHCFRVPLSNQVHVRLFVRTLLLQCLHGTTLWHADMACLGSHHVPRNVDRHMDTLDACIVRSDNISGQHHAVYFVHSQNVQILMPCMAFQTPG